MSRNSREIDYRLRLAKSVERRMLCSAFQKLTAFYPLKQYKYIGFGAYYFSDFYLFHKELGIDDMISIEKSHSNETKIRHEFNKPFKCIKIIFKESKVALTELKWDRPTIIWLDYTDVLQSDILTDLRTVMSSAKSGSVYLITLSADSESYEPNKDEHPTYFNRLDVIKEMIGEANVPRAIKNNMLSNKEIHKVYRDILMNSILNILFSRNSGGNQTNYQFHQLFNFRYKDNNPMYSFGGIIYDEKTHHEDLNRADFNDLSFVRSDSEVFSIDIPNLTLKEIKYLESIMPLIGSEFIEDENTGLEVFKSNPCIPYNDIEKFSKIYHYFPTFTESRVG